MNEYDEYEEPVEFTNAKRHARYFGWYVGLLSAGLVLWREYPLSGGDGILAIVAFLIGYAATAAFIYFCYFALPSVGDVIDAIKQQQRGDDDDPPPAAPQRELVPRQPSPQNSDGAAAKISPLLLLHRAEIREARASGKLSRVSINKLTQHTSAKKYNEGNPAAMLKDALEAFGHIDENGDWTPSGNQYSLPHPTNRGGLADGSNRLQPVESWLQPVGEG